MQWNGSTQVNKVYKIVLVISSENLTYCAFNIWIKPQWV